MKKFLVFTGLLFLMALAGLLAAPSFIDWNQYRPQLQALVESRTGCRLDIRDNVKFDLFPSPQLTLVELALIPEGSTASSAPFAARWLQADLSFRTLLQGDISVERLHLIEPVLQLDHWQECWPVKEDGPQERAAVKEASQDAGSAFQIQKVTLSNGRLSGRSGLLDQHVELPIPSATLSYDPKRSQYHLIGEGRLADQITRFDLSYNDLPDGSSKWGRLKLNLPEISGNATIGFRQDQNDGSWLGKIEADIQQPEKLAQLKQIFPAVTLLSDLVNENASINFNSDYRYGVENLTFSQMNLRNGSYSIQGDLTQPTEAEEPTSGRFKIKFLDLDRQIPPAGSSPEISESAANDNSTNQSDNSPETTPEAGFATLDKLLAEWRRPLSLELTVDQIQYRKSLIREAYLRFSNDENGIIVDSARALLPGGSDISMIGTIDRHEQGLELIGDLSFQSDDLRRFLRWAGIEPTGLSENRLRSLRLSSQVTMGPASFGLHAIDARLDSTQLTGSLQRQETEQAVQIDSLFKIDRLNLDAYGNGDTLPRILAWLQSGFRLAGSQATEEIQASSEPKTGQAPLHKPSLPTYWTTDLEISQLTSNGLPMEGLSLTLAQRTDGLLLERFQLDDLRGLSLQASGRLPSLDNRQKASLAISYYLPNPERTAARFGSSPHIRRLFGRLGGGSGSLLLEGDLDKMAARLHFDGVKGRILLDTDTYLTQIPQKIVVRNGQFKLPEFVADDLKGMMTLEEDGSVNWQEMTVRWQDMDIRTSGHAKPETGGIDLTGTASLRGETLGPIGDITGGYLQLDGMLQADLKLSASKLNLDRPLDRLDAEGVIQGGLRLEPGEELSQNNHVKQIRNLRQFIEKGFQGNTSPLTGQVRLKAGILELQAIEISGKGASAKLNARLNSGNARLNAELTLMDNSGAEPVFSLKASGPMDRPNLKTAGSWLKAN